ncbi:Membrane protein YdfJ [Streptomyces sp. RB5]|uniref:Membrane protein YdfJ n=1 Tax=Streptomyces smaragdinus TaxID=2585196 RepID=A0A7K0CJU8_9ACTN|nr:MMPL family transporter [Streptomyces smaragdinus]MQY13726.1 Membrane protein YdfJ [Streptomyces smaragdinus]
MLNSLARTATRRPITVMVVWLLMLLLGFGIGIRVFEDLEGTVEDIPGSESVRTGDLLGRLDPDGPGITGVVAGTDVTRPAVRAQVGAAVADLRRLPGVAAVADPYTTGGVRAEDGQALLIPITLEGGMSDDDEEEASGEAAARIARIDAAPEAYTSGGPLLGVQMGERAQEDVAHAELITLPAVLLLLLLIFGGLRSALLPLVVTLCGVAGAFLTLYGFSQVTDISVYAVQIVTMLGLGLAVDYALLMVVRFREERRRTEDVAEAVRRTVARAGRTVLFSGLTVAVSLSGLLVFPSPFLRSMGMAAAAVVVVDMLAALTLLPALLTRFGVGVSPARTELRAWGRIRPAKADRSGAVFARLARFSAARRVVVLAVVAVGLVLLALPAAGTRLAVGDARSLPRGTEARDLYETVGAHFPEGAVTSPVRVLMGPGTDPDCLPRFRALPGTAAAETRTFDDGSTVLDLTPRGDVDGPAATRLVRDIRDLRGDEPVQVTGVAAKLVDFRAALASRVPWAIAVVLLGITVLLFAFTGSLLIPLRTIATTLLSLGAALGVVTWVFQDGHLASWLGGEGLGALNLTAPPLILAIAFGLAMDYELFILGRMREAYEATGDPAAAVEEGLRRSGRVVTSAAFLLALVFAGFMTGGFSPVLQIGLGLTLAVLIDSTVVRMLLVPATMALLGRRAWWAPAPLRRLHARVAVREM